MELVGFPAFIPAGHFLHGFSDCAFHVDCFEHWEFKEEMKGLYQQYQGIWNTRPRNVSLDEIERWGQKAFDGIFEPGMKDTSTGSGDNVGDIIV